MLNYAQTFDLLWISEIKTRMKISVPGFETYYNVDLKNSHRGGILLLVKHRLVPFINHIDLAKPSQIWISLSCCKNVVLGGCYIPPIDSDYRDVSILGSLQSKLMAEESGSSILLGDLNARMWNEQLLASTWPDNEAAYYELEDHTVNEQGKVMIQMCKDTGCAVLNHLQHNNRRYGGGLSFKKRSWISELDVCIATRHVIPLISHLRIENTKQLPSDHAPMEVTIDLTLCDLPTDTTLDRTAALGKHMITQQSGEVKGLPLHMVNETAFRNTMQEIHPPNNPTEFSDINRQLMQLNDTLNRAARQARVTLPHTPQWNPQQERWIRLIRSSDDRTIWKAIGWNGSIEECQQEAVPSDTEFKDHFESLLDVGNHNVLSIDTEGCPYIPLLDDQFTPVEVEHAFRCAKNRAFIGACTGLFGWLPATWLFYITILFNFIFMCASYPERWCFNRLVVLFKSGARTVCGNYRGISIMDSAAKIYDLLLNARLSQWLNIDKAQAGAQKGRGCIEQIITLRLLVDYAKHQKKKLFLLFVDFQKAYDKVPRKKLLECLKSRGCGRVMLEAIVSLYRNTKFILRTATINADIGVRQGAPTSCLLFVLYIDQLSRLLKAQHREDDFLGTLHALMLMDDTVILSTSRTKCIDKLKTLENFCNEYGMVLNSRKTKLMVINGDADDRAPLQIDTGDIGYTNHYVYLGAHFLDDGLMQSVMKCQADACIKHVNKFASFIHKNANMPFTFKLRVLKAALLSSILYGCESWLTDNIGAVNKHYMAIVKLLLGVRVSIPHMICLIELGLPELSSIILKRQGNFMRSYMERSSGDEPLALALQLCTGTAMYQRLCKAANHVGDPEFQSVENLRIKCQQKASTSTRLATYLDINTNLRPHSIYSQDEYIPDTWRVALTRLRLSSHRLRVEVGRWQRIPRELRTCPCDSVSVQDEEHAILHCHNTIALRRENYPHVDCLIDFWQLPNFQLARMCSLILSSFY